MSNAPIAPGSLVLVTGGTGFIGSHVVRMLLHDGYRVRLPARTQEKGDKFVEYFSQFADQLEVVVIPDALRPGAYDEAVKGVAGIAHLATAIKIESTDYDEVVGPSIAGTVGVLQSALNYGSTVQRVSICSSSGASGQPNPVPRAKFEADPSIAQKLDATTWNDKSIETIDKQRKEGKITDGLQLYFVSKVLAERAAHDFIKNENPPFTVSMVLPNANFGDLIPCATVVSTGAWSQSVADGQDLTMIEPQWFVNADDTARLLIQALVAPDIKAGERIWAVSERFGWNDIAAEVKKVKPDAKVVTVEGDKDLVDASDIDATRGQQLLKEFGGFQGLGVTVRQGLGLEKPRIR